MVKWFLQTMNRLACIPVVSLRWNTRTIETDNGKQFRRQNCAV
jgi:hypothetical protein